MRRYLSFCAIGFLISLSQCNHEEENQPTDPNMMGGTMSCTMNDPKQFTVQSKGLEGTNPIQFKSNGMELSLKTSKTNESMTLTSKNELEGDFHLGLGYEDAQLAAGATIQIVAISEKSDRSTRVDLIGAKTGEQSSEQITMYKPSKPVAVTYTCFGMPQNLLSGRINISRTGDNMTVSITHGDATSVNCDLKTKSIDDVNDPDSKFRGIFGTEPVQLVISLQGAKDGTDSIPSSVRLTDIQVSDGNKITSEKFSCTP